MTVPIRFVGGPLDGYEARIDRLDHILVFFPPDTFRAVGYWRMDELVYAWGEKLSDELTESYGDTLNKYSGNPPALLFEGPSPFEV